MIRSPVLAKESELILFDTILTGSGSFVTKSIVNAVVLISPIETFPARSNNKAEIDAVSSCEKPVIASNDP